MFFSQDEKIKDVGLIIRELRKNDFRSFAQLRNSTINESDYMLFEPGEIIETKSTVRNYLTDSTKTLIATFNGTFVGYTILKIPQYKKSKHCAHLIIAVKKEFRGKGIGTELMHKIEALAHAIGILRIELEVITENPAKNLYERSGYITEGRKIGVIFQNNRYLDVISMAKHLK
jgi:ribosomal protein S18 acetylase RimI-like enzyme